MAECSPFQCSEKQSKPRWLIVAVVAVALLIDCILFTALVPIAPAYIYDSESMKGTEFATYSNNSVFTFESSLNSIPLLDNTTETPYHDPNINLTQKSGSGRVCYTKKDLLQEENFQVGLLLSVKAIVQLMVNPFVGFITNRIGYDTPLFCGFCFTFMSAVIVTLANSYALLMVARGLHGIGSCCTSVAGMGLLADVYPDDYERGKAMGFAMSVMAIGLLGGAPFGSVMYQFTGKEAPFLVIAGFALVDGALQLYTLKPLKFSPRNMPLPPYRALLTDPYILIAAGSLCICNLSYGILEPTLTIRMMEYMCSPRWELGLAFLPSMLTFMIVVNVFGMLAHKIGRWLCILIGLIALGVSCLCMPLPTNFYELIAPVGGIGFGFGLVDTAATPTLAYLADLRHTSVYGGIYAISDLALGIGYALGPLGGGAIVRTIGFSWLMVIIGLVNIFCCPLAIFLRNPPGKEENMSLINEEKSPEVCCVDSPGPTAAPLIGHIELSKPVN